MKHFLLFFLIFSSTCTNTQTKSESDKAYIDSIEKYIYSYEQDSLDSELSNIQASGFITKKKFKLFRRTIGGFSEYTAWNKKNNQYFNYWYGENHFNKRKYEDLYVSFYFKDNQLVKYIKELENKKYIYRTTVYFKDSELISLETDDPNFNLEEIKKHEAKAVEILERAIKSNERYR